MAYFDALTTTQVAALTSTQIGALTATDMASLQSTQISTLSSTQIASLSTSNISGITTEVIPYLTVTQMPAFETSDLASLTSSQVSAIETTDLNALTSTQLAAFGADQEVGLTTTQIGALTSTQVAALDYGNFADFATAYSANNPQVSGPNQTYLITPPNPIPVAIPTGQTWSSGMIPMNGFNSVVVGVKGDQVLTVTVQRYIDSSGTLAVGAAGALTSVANTAGYTSALSANVPATHFKVTCANTSGDVCIISNFAIAVQSN